MFLTGPKIGDMNTSITDRLAKVLETLPEDLALMIVLSGLSLKTETVARAIEMAIALQELRRLDAEVVTPEKIVENVMIDFQVKLDKLPEKAPK